MKLKTSVKSQVALEFLTTYGWAFLVQLHFISFYEGAWNIVWWDIIA